MTGAPRSVLEEALTLPVEARLDLVEKLLTSLNVPADGEVEELWVREAERRVAEIDRGEVTPVQGEELFTRLREKHRR